MVRRLMLFALAVGVTVSMLPSPVSAQTVPPAERVLSLNSEKVLDVRGGSTANGTPIIQWTPHNGTNQQFRRVPVEGKPGVFRLVNVLTNKCVDVNGGSLANGASIIQWQCHSGLNQQWKINVPEDGVGERIVSVNSNKCMDVNRGSTANGASIIQWQCHLGLNQRWEFLTAGA